MKDAATRIFSTVPVAAHILLVEDEPEVATFVRKGLEEESYQVSWLDRAAHVTQRLEQESIDLVLLDVRLPDESGHVVCRRIRNRMPLLPIVMLTALDSVEDRVAGLRAGADDYIGKPFAFEELLARIEANLRRGHRQTPAEVLAVGDLRIELSAAVARCGTQEIDLTPREYELLVDLASHPGVVRSRDDIHRDVWGMDFDRGTNLINVYVTYLRSKLRDAGSTVMISAVRGRGYRLDAVDKTESGR